MNLYPVLLDLRGAPCLVVGGGAVATRKVRALLEAGAAVTAVAPELTAELAELKERGRIDHVAGSFEDTLLEAFRLVFAATNDRRVNDEIARRARDAEVWVNIADDPDASTFQVPAHFRRGELTVAVSTGGASPAEARRVRETLEELFPADYARYLALLRAVRSRVLAERGAGEDGNAALFTRLVRSDLRARYLAGDAPGAEAVLREILGASVALADLETAGAE